MNRAERRRLRRERVSHDFDPAGPDMFTPVGQRIDPNASIPLNRQTIGEVLRVAAAPWWVRQLAKLSPKFGVVWLAYRLRRIMKAKSK